jgi:hypothetical protein
LEHKVEFPEDCVKVLKEIKKKQISAMILRGKFPDMNFDKVIEDLGHTNAISRILVREGEHDAVHYVVTNNKVDFKQGRNQFINRKDLGNR